MKFFLMTRVKRIEESSRARPVLSESGEVSSTTDVVGYEVVLDPGDLVFVLPTKPWAAGDRVKITMERAE